MRFFPYISRSNMDRWIDQNACCTIQNHMYPKAANNDFVIKIFILIKNFIINKI